MQVDLHQLNCTLSENAAWRRDPYECLCGIYEKTPLNLTGRFAIVPSSIIIIIKKRIGNKNWSYYESWIEKAPVPFAVPRYCFQPHDSFSIIKVIQVSRKILKNKRTNAWITLHWLVSAFRFGKCRQHHVFAFLKFC